MTEFLPRLLSEKEIVVLRLLAPKTSALRGLEIVEASGGEIGRGTIYVTLYRMIEKGLVSSKAIRAPGVFRPGARYRITAEGTRRLDAYERFIASV